LEDLVSVLLERVELLAKLSQIPKANGLRIFNKNMKPNSKK
jgi:hypothetical protein